VSFDSTIKANLSVGLPLDLHIYDKDSILPAKSMKIERDNPYFSMVSHQWGEALKNSLAALPKFSLE